MATFPPAYPTGGFTCRTDPPTSTDPGAACEKTGKVTLALRCSLLTPGGCAGKTTYNFGAANGPLIKPTGGFNIYTGAVTPGDGRTTADTTFLDIFPGGSQPYKFDCHCR
jgi:hypothetical protein